MPEHLLQMEHGAAVRGLQCHMDCAEMELLKRDVLRGSDGHDCFVLTLDDEAESQEAEEHILQWL
jgi:hypothetical protein